MNDGVFVCDVFDEDPDEPFGAFRGGVYADEVDWFVGSGHDAKLIKVNGVGQQEGWQDRTTVECRCGFV